MKWENFKAVDERDMVRLREDGRGGAWTSYGAYERLPNGKFRVDGARKSFDNEHDVRAAVTTRALLAAENMANRLHAVLRDANRNASMVVDRKVVPRGTVGGAAR